MVLFTGKTVAEAIDNGLRTLKLTKNQVQIDVLNGPKGVFHLDRQAKVEVIPKERRYRLPNQPSSTQPSNLQINDERDPSEILTGYGRAVGDYVHDVLHSLGITSSEEIVLQDEQLEVHITADDYERLTGPNGATIEALQLVANQLLHRHYHGSRRVILVATEVNH